METSHICRRPLLSPRGFPIVIRRVWSFNLVPEFHFIANFLPYFPFASFDTEFPGAVYHSSNHWNPIEVYRTMKRNVDDMKIIQLGLTLSDGLGNLPYSSGSGCQYIWEFNFKDFDCDVDLHNPESISLLRRQGIEFEMNRKFGIRSCDFAAMFINSGIMRSRIWLTFHGIYDFGYLIKIVTQKQLPSKLDEFLDLVRKYFGENVYDLKSIARSVGIHGSLEKVAATLTVNRGVGQSHQAGSDSLLILRSFLGAMNLKTREEMSMVLKSCNHKIYGCEFVSH